VKSSVAVVRSSILSDFRRVALAFDLNPLALLDRVGIDSRCLDDPELTLPVSAIVELFEVSALTSGIEDFGLRVGEARGVPDLGPLILMLREAATVREALRTLVSLLHMHSNGVQMHLDETADPILTIELMAPDVGHCRQAIDSGLAGMTHLVRWVLGDDWTPVTVHFVHSRPTSKARYERFFGCPVCFMRDVNGIVLRRRDLDRKLSGSTPAMRRQVERYIRSINIAPSDTYVHGVTEMVAMALPRGEAKAENIARHLGTDRRTLNRRLARANLNFSAVVSNVRRNLVVQYLLAGNRSLTDVAVLVGFDSLSAFTRWFRASFGMPPGAWRRTRDRYRPNGKVRVPIGQTRGKQPG
jgi:AraC-like DNA-binding protein